MSRQTSRTNTRRPDMAVVKQRRRAVLRHITQGAGLALALGVTVSGLLLLNDRLCVEAWNIECAAGSPATLDRQLEKAMQSLPDYDFWSTRPSALRTHLLASVPDLEEIEISRTMSGSLQLKAIPRIPTGLWQNGDSNILLVDAKGVAYRQLAQGEESDLPVLRVAKEDIEKATELMRSMQAAEPEFHTAISELLSEGNSWKINFNQGQQWIIPRVRNISYAINRVGSLLDQPRWRAGHWRVDARSKTRWFIRPARQEGVI